MQTEWPFQQDVFPHLKFKVGLSYCFNRNCALVYCPHPMVSDAAPDSPDTSGVSQEPAGKDATEDTKAAEGGGGAEGTCVLRVLPALRSWQEARVTPDGSTLLFMSHDHVRSSHRSTYHRCASACSYVSRAHACRHVSCRLTAPK